MKYFLLIFFLSVALALVLSSPWPWSRPVCLGPGLAVFLVLPHFALGGVLVSLEAFWTTPLRRLSQTETRWVSESERERVISVELCAFTGTAYYATPYVNKVTVWCNNVLDCFTVGSLLLCFLFFFNHLIFYLFFFFLPQPCTSSLAAELLRIECIDCLITRGFKWK